MRLIDADELTEAVWRERLDTRERIADLVARQPTVKTDVQPVKHGRWVFQNRYDEDGRCIFHCSECNFETKVFPCNLIPWQMHEKYCARCGARMDGDRDD